MKWPYEKRKFIGVRLFNDFESSRRDTHQEQTHINRNSWSTKAFRPCQANLRRSSTLTHSSQRSSSQGQPNPKQHCSYSSWDPISLDLPRHGFRCWPIGKFPHRFIAIPNMSTKSSTDPTSHPDESHQRFPSAPLRRCSLAF